MVFEHFLRETYVRFMWDVTESILDICIVYSVYLRRTRSCLWLPNNGLRIPRCMRVTRPRSLDDHRVQRPDGQVDGERGRQ